MGMQVGRSKRVGVAVVVTEVRRRERNGPDVEVEGLVTHVRTL